MGYENRKLVNEDGPNDAESRTSGPWSDIRERSVVDFVNAVSARLGDPSNRSLREQLYAAVFSNGAKPVRFAGFTYTGPMLLSVYYGAGREAQADEAFKTRAEWDDFARGMANLRNPAVPMVCREKLLAIGESIEARQLPHAKRMGWA